MGFYAHKHVCMYVCMGCARHVGNGVVMVVEDEMRGEFFFGPLGKSWQVSLTCIEARM